MQLEFFIPLVLFLNILRLWGRRKVHSPPTPFLMHYNPSPLNLLLPSHFFRVPFAFSSKKELFALRDPQSTLHRGASPPPPTSASAFGSLVLCSSWCSFFSVGVGDRIAMGFGDL